MSAPWIFKKNLEFTLGDIIATNTKGDFIQITNITETIKHGIIYTIKFNGTHKVSDLNKQNLMAWIIGLSEPTEMVNILYA